MTYPTLFYRTPGPHRKPGGIRYAYIGVRDEDQAAAKIADGWFPTLAEAVAGELAGHAVEKAAELAEVIDEIEGPSRDALEEEARSLNIGFNARTSDTVLAQRIAAKRIDA